jgi:ribonuclease T
MNPACYISIDVETAGPAPSRFPLLSIGACLVNDPRQTFYVELQPDLEQIEPGALEVSGLDPDRLRQTGIPPAVAMARFADWIHAATPPGETPVFVAFNAPFDWMFVQDYFQRYQVENPFGHAALDMKALAMGLLGIEWGDTAMKHVADRLEADITLSHNALQDAIDQAGLFKHLLAEMETKFDLKNA